MNKGVLSSSLVKGAELPDKVDMSLDEIIRMNKKEKQLKRKNENLKQRPVKKKKKGKNALQRTGGNVPGAAGGSVPGGLRNRKVPTFRARWRGQGSGVTAGRRPPAVLKRNAPINRQNMKTTDVKQKQRQRRRPFPQNNPDLHRALYTSTQTHTRLSTHTQTHTETHTRLNTETHTRLNTHTEPLRRPFQLQRRAQTPVPQSHKETRQATFLFRRGLKVQTQLQKPNVTSAPLKTQLWSSLLSASAAPGGAILTVSIDNPTARTQPEPPSSWTLHPPSIISAPVKVETVEKKIPKGVPLQFDINSVGKPQTSMTLNERFRILKDQRSSVTQNNKGGRFVTVG